MIYQVLIGGMLSSLLHILWADSFTASPFKSDFEFCFSRVIIRSNCLIEKWKNNW